MKNIDKLVNSFTSALGLKADEIKDCLEYNTIPSWDSIAHMSLVSELEAAFDIMLDTDDIIDMSSVIKVKEILSKYDVNFD